MQKKAKTRSKQTEKVEKEKKQEHEEPKKQEPKQEKQESKHHFCLYDLLEVSKEASPDEIKKQYRKLVLQYHPDKNKDDPSAREKFQKLKEAYDILMDAEKRKEYDETGRIGDQFDENNFEAAYNYFRTLYKRVSPEDIKSFEERYRFGEMEKEDLLNYYQEHSGDMSALIQSIPLSTNDDIPRFITFFEESIANKSLPKFKIFDKTKGKVRLLKDETEQFEKEKIKDMGALVAAIQGRSNNQKDFIAQIQAKYGGKKKADPKLRKKKE